MSAASPSRRLRVLHLIETFGRGGAEVLLAQALPRLQRHVDVRVRALGPPDTLHHEFVQGGIDSVVVCGFSTSGCVRATTLDACQHGFVPIVVRDA